VLDRGVVACNGLIVIILILLMAVAIILILLMAVASNDATVLGNI
jgi:hypothetical protein